MLDVHTVKHGKRITLLHVGYPRTLGLMNVDKPIISRCK
jgi:hypothetical protein